MLGYILWHQLFVYSCFTCLLSARLFMYYYSVVCLSCYLVILYLQLSCYYSMHIVYMHEQSSLHTHSLGRFWRPWIRTSRVLDIFLYYSGFIELVRVTRGWSLSFLDYRYYCSFVYVISWFYLYHIPLSFFSLFICYHCVHIYMSYCSDIDLS